jgi:lactoylglutathione lyase
MTAMPKATGLFETHLMVSDVDRSIEFYRDVVGLPLALVIEERGAAFFWIAGPGEAMLGLWSLDSAPMGLSLHIALRASLPDVLAACHGLRSSDLTPLSFFGAETSEPSVIGWMPAAADFVDAELASREIRDLSISVMVGNSGAKQLYEPRGLKPAEIVLYRFGSADAE